MNKKIVYIIIVALVAIVASCRFVYNAGINRGIINAIDGISYCESEGASGYYNTINNTIRCIYE